MCDEHLQAPPDTGGPETQPLIQYMAAQLAAMLLQCPKEHGAGTDADGKRIFRGGKATLKKYG